MSRSAYLFPVLICAAIVLGFVWPGPGRALQSAAAPLLMIMMGLSMLKMNLSSFINLPALWWRYLIILFLVFVVPTAIIFLFKNLVSKELFVGLLLAAAAPAGVSVVFMADILGGEPAKALGATTLAHLVSPVVMPALVWLYARTLIEVDVAAMALLIAKFIFFPFIAAQILKKIPVHQKILPHVSLLNTILLVIIIWAVVGPVSAMIVANSVPALIAGAIVAVVMVVEVITAIRFGRTRHEDITWSVVNTYKNYVLAAVLAGTFFGPAALMGAIIYSIVDNLVLIPLSLWAARK